MTDGHSDTGLVSAVGTSNGSDTRQGIQSVEIAVTVLLALEQGNGPMTLSQIAQLTGMHPSKVHRYLVSLGRGGLVAQSPTSGLYDLGTVLRRLGAEALRRMDEVSVASEHLTALRDRTLHAVNLSVWGDHGPIVVRWEYGSYALPMTVRVGATLPLVTSSVGRVFLSYLPEAMTSPILAELETSRQDGEAARYDLRRIIDEVRQSGVAVTTGGVLPGVASVAAPVFTHDASLPLVVAIALPDRTATPDVIAAITRHLLTVTREMSADLGSVGEPQRLHAYGG